ncbi:MAG TPA: tol-pal system protein YbgF [Thermoanaerobaculia bacterium]|nr:tol-pal system protein YbgF [Thermoanaerobaculia bacterium]
MRAARGSVAVRLVAGLFAVALAGGCSGALARPSGESSSEIQELRQRLVAMQQQAAVHQLAIEELRAQVASLEAALGVRRGSQTGSPAVPRPAPPPVATDRRAVVPPSGADAPIRDEDLEVADLDAPQVPVSRPATPAPVAEAPPAGGAQTSSTIPPAGQALYDRGYTLYHQGRYLDAEASFQRFLQAHGDSDLGDNAQYWIGESRYARGDHRGALAAFQETAARYPQGNKVPDALLKAGQSLEQLGDPEGARAAYRTVVERFAASAAAVAAEERLARLR